MVKILELFGGIGAPRKALLDLGYNVKSIDYVEIDAKAVRSYNAMFDNGQRPQNIVGWDLKPDILIHGSPCQDFSIAGKQQGADKGSGTRSSLLHETLRIIRCLGIWKPQVVIWENVKNVLSKHMVHNFNGYLEELESLGYSNSYKVLNAIDYGLPQKRERVFVVSILDGKAFDFSKMQKQACNPLSDYLGDYGPQHIVTQQSVLNCIGAKGIRRATVLNDYAFTVTTRQDRTPAQVIKCSEDKFRYLTERECWRLQGFDDADFDAALAANPSDGKLNRVLYKQAGNSMPVNVLREMFRVLRFC